MIQIYSRPYNNWFRKSSLRSSSHETLHLCHEGHFHEHTGCSSKAHGTIDICSGDSIFATTVHMSLIFCQSAASVIHDMFELLGYTSGLHLNTNWGWRIWGQLSKNDFYTLMSEELIDPYFSDLKNNTYTSMPPTAVNDHPAAESIGEAMKVLRYKGGVGFYNKVYDLIMYSELQ